MFKLIKRFLKEEDGLGTVEIVIIVAVLVAVALIFRRAIFEFVSNMVRQIFDNNDLQNESLKGITPTP